MTEGLPTAVMGRTGIELSRLGYGTWEIEGRIEGNPISRPVSEKHVSLMLNTALDSGMSIIDTADCYGHAEEFIGRSVSHRRDEFVIATKCGCNWRGRSRSTPPKQFTRESVFKNIDRSLTRLKTDHVDFLQLHNPKAAEVEDNELIDALLEVKRQGKTRWIGMSSDMPQLPPLAAFEELDVFQVGYQPMQRESEEWIKKLGDDGRGIIIRSRAAKGQPHYEGTLAYNQGRIASGPGTWANFDRAKLDELRDDGDSRIAFMLRYTISLPQAHTVVVGTLSLEHMEENVRAVQRGPLSPDTLAEANRRLEELGFTAAAAA